MAKKSPLFGYMELLMFLVPILLGRKRQASNKLRLIGGERTPVEKSFGLEMGDEALASRLSAKWGEDVRKAHDLYPLIPSALIFAVIHGTSRGKEDIVTEDFKEGLMELSPIIQQRYGVSDPMDPWDNIEGGTHYLSDLSLVWSGTVSNILAAYRWGDENMRKYKAGELRIPKEIPLFAERVEKLYKLYDSIGL